MGGNAVLGFKQYFDFEGEGGGGIVARACGTACIVGKENETSQIVVNPTPAAGVAPSSDKLLTSVPSFLSYLPFAKTVLMQHPKQSH